MYDRADTRFHLFILRDSVWKIHLNGEPSSGRVIRAGLKPIEPHAGVIYSWLFKYTQQHTAGFTENNWALSWSYLLLAVQVHTTTYCRFYREYHWASHLLRPTQVEPSSSFFQSFFFTKNNIALFITTCYQCTLVVQVQPKVTVLHQQITFTFL